MSDAALTHGLHAAHHPRQMHHFDSMAQQKETATFGMWVFLVTEIMFFGGMFASYMIYRMTDSNAFFYSSEHMNFWAGTINTVVLITSSVTVVLAIHAIQMGLRRLSALFWVMVCAPALSGKSVTRPARKMTLRMIETPNG